MKEPSKEQFKELAKTLRQVLREKHDVDLKHGHALEVFSKVFGYKDWNTTSALSARMSRVSPITEESIADSNHEKPIAAKLPEAGVLADFFATFPRDTKVFVNEYKDAELDENNSRSVSEALAGMVTSICSLTYDSEIQNGTELRLELNTEAERHFRLKDFGRSVTQSFDKTKAGRSQRRIKYLHMQNSFWNPEVVTRSYRKQ